MSDPFLSMAEAIVEKDRIAELEAERDDWKMAAHAWQRPDDVVLIDGQQWRVEVGLRYGTWWSARLVPVEETDE